MDWVAILSVIFTDLSLLIGVKTIKQNNKINKEANRAYIVFYIRKSYGTNEYFLNIKNFGKTEGKLLDIQLSPKLSYEKTEILKDIRDIKLLTEMKDVYFAPNQCITSYFPFEEYLDRNFNVLIRYETLNEIIEDNYSINIDYIDWAIDYNTNINSEKQFWNNINKNIKEIS